MKNSRNTKRALLASVMSLVLCVAMLIGTTFAWFTDSVTTGNNTIQAGNLDVDLQYSKDGETWATAENATNIFDANALWEPGYTQVVYLKVINKGNLTLKYQFGINVASNTKGKTADGQEIDLSNYIKFGVVSVNSAFESRDKAREAVESSAKLISDGYSSEEGPLAAGANSGMIALVVYMPEDVGNEANHGTDKTAPQIDLGISLAATQDTVEKDSFDDQYDKDAPLDFVPVSSADELVTAIAKAKAGDVIDLEKDIALSSAITVPEGVTIYGNGNTISGYPVSAGNNTAFYGVVFDRPTNASDNASCLYAQSLSGKVIIDGCTFTETQWDSIQITPVDGAEIIIQNCTFSNTSTTGYRYIHIEATKNADCNAKVSILNNTFGSADKVTNALIDVDYLDYENNLTAGGNTFADSKEKIVEGEEIFICNSSYTSTMDFGDAYDLFTK